MPGNIQNEHMTGKISPKTMIGEVCDLLWLVQLLDWSVLNEILSITLLVKMSWNVYIQHHVAFQYLP